MMILARTEKAANSWKVRRKNFGQAQRRVQLVEPLRQLRVVLRLGRALDDQFHHLT